jgi:hypothetical protein
MEHQEEIYYCQECGEEQEYSALDKFGVCESCLLVKENAQGMAIYTAEDFNPMAVYL